MTYYEDVITEFLEVFIHSLIYARKLYPDEIFRQQRIYNIPVWTSVFPPVVEYIRSVLKTAHFLLSTNSLFKVEIIIYKEETRDQIIETYNVEVLQLTTDNRDTYLFEFEDNVSRALLLLDERIKNLPKLPPSCRFKILLQTTRSAYVDMKDENDLSDFLWYREDIGETSSSNSENSKDTILPITNIDQFGIQVYVEVKANEESTITDR